MGDPNQTVKGGDRYAIPNVKQAQAPPRVKAKSPFSKNSPGPVDKNTPADAAKGAPQTTQKSRKFDPKKKGKDASQLKMSDFQQVADDLEVDVAIIVALAFKESNFTLKGFYSDGRPRILYERHVFSRRTAKKFDKTYPELSGPAGNYGRSFTKLTNALDLDEKAALESCSWGLFQIMGFNYKAAGYKNVYKMLDAIYESEGKHLDAFVEFCRSLNVIQPMKDKNWHLIAYRYNGAGYKSKAKKGQRNYAEDLKYWWKHFSEDSVGRLSRNSKADYDAVLKLLKNARLVVGNVPDIKDGDDCPEVVAQGISRFERTWLKRSKPRGRLVVDSAAYKRLQALVEAPKISGYVGKTKSGGNNPRDVLTVQNLLKRAGYFAESTQEVPRAGPQTIKAINDFQKDHLKDIGIEKATGIIGTKSMPVLIKRAKQNDVVK